jgi:xanthine/CO dehydrogenase XdhC/CoxF family maturation factor
MLLRDDCGMLRAVMSVRQILRTFDAWRARGEPIVLATVYDTLGSTYTKAGHRILISASGDYQGLVSGGCLEGDLAARAREVAARGEAQAITYDLRDEADALWGLGIGCNGLLRVFLQPLTAADGYQPFAAIAECLLANRAAGVATVIASELEGVQPGATLLWTPETSQAWGLDSTVQTRLAGECERAVTAGRAHFSAAEQGLAVLYAPLKPVPRLLVLGAGLDAVPLVDMASNLGWLVTVADHRPAYIDREGFEGAERAIALDPRELALELALEEFDAIVVMSHHLATDRVYLEQLAHSRVHYLGVLGPAKRRERLLDELGDRAGELPTMLRGPVGIDIGADSPESIALSLLAEIHATLAGASGSALTRRR